MRNETITTPNPSPAARAVAPANETPVTGLFLIQFEGPLQPAWRQQLQAVGVDLLTYVPDDAFIARLSSGRPGQIRRLDFVRWLGVYRPEHKVHRSLVTAAARTPGAPLDVAVLLSPRATEADAAQARRSMLSVSQESNQRFGRVLRGRLNPAQLETLAQSDSVLWIEPAPPMKLLDEVSSKIVAGDGGPNTLLMQSLGYDGSGVKVAVADSGLDSGDTNAMHPDIAGRVTALFYYGASGQLTNAADEHGHGTHVAGIIAGNGATGEKDENGFLYGLGVAPESDLIAQRIFDANGGYAPPSSFEKLTRDAKRAGADIGSNSWGDDTQGRYDLSAMEFDGLVRDADALALGDQPYILEFSAGNAGPNYRTVGSPAVAKNVIATGAANSDRRNLPLAEFAIYADGPDSMTDFSSRGPCEDGRIKPDVVAPGSWIASLRSIYANDDFAWWPISDNYFYMGGTSQAGPHVSGAAAVFVQYYRNTHSGATPSPALVKAALINSAADMDDAFGTAPTPNMDEGWGRVDLPALIGSNRDYDFVDQTVLLTNGAVYEKRILVGSAGESLRVTLAYTDVPGIPASVVALVNNLDLEVQSPDGHLYRGNQFADGESVPDLPTADTINNVEGVNLYAPPPGEYVIRVRASRVVEDARQDTGAIDQDFALVASASAGTPGVGIVTFDRPVYRAPDLIRFALVDYDLAGQATANLLVRSGTESAGETIVLHASGPNGVFTGALATVTGSVAGSLQVSNGDIIQAVYADAQPASNRVFTALADLQPPVISNVGATNRFGQIAVAWDTDEDANSIVYYGTNTLDRSITNRALDVVHEIALENILPDSVQKFMVVSVDAAGNCATNNNGGQYFTVTNTQPPGILLVDSFADYAGLITAPPLSGYTNALDTLGVAYDVFDATGGANPTLAQLQAYRCVIWRVSDLDVPSPDLTQRITDYVNSGGSLFLASMEALSRFTDANLTNFNTDILRVVSFTVDQPVDTVTGTPGEPVGAGINVTLDYTPYADILAVAGTDTPSDWIVPNPTNATAVMQSGSPIVGLRSPKTGVDLPGRVVFFSFPFDAVPLGTGVGNNRSGLLQNVLNYLVPAPGASSLVLDSDVYSVPGRAVAEVEDHDLQGQGSTTIHVQSPQHTNQILVTLTETIRPGLFRGSFVFTPTNTGTFGTLFVQSGDTVEATYNDASSGQTLTAEAAIQTNAPAISVVAIDPGYLEAIVTWDTSEPADSLVQYSESPLTLPVNYTAYDPALNTAHELLLSGLKPNQTYYLRVTSRDRAGNTSVDDNNGQFYTFTTLQPHVPPWVDDIETPNAEWSTFASEGSETEWTRGSPGGGLSAHSPTNCWGSNLSGGAPAASETYLVSPGVFLTDGNHATLRFWHNYDFSQQPESDVELATVEIITNVAMPSQLLWQLPYGSASGGWKEVDLDLTPYMGQVVYIVWYYFLFAGEDPPLDRTGWLVDDVSITTTNVQSGTIQITNNLWQAVFSLSGPIGGTGTGTSMTVAGAPPGEYVLDYGDALYYQAPPSQTNTLAAGGTLVFNGNYTFADANSNGIPDGWELAQFGSIDPQRTRTTDTDADGMSDWAEFVAGTDPNNPPPAFKVAARLVGNGLVQFSWQAVSNHLYRVHGSANFSTWSDYSGWLTATGTNLTYTVSVLTNGSPGFFRVETMVPGGPNAIPANLRVSATRQFNGSVRLDWPSALGHGYRVLSSPDLKSWTPFSPWIRASGVSTSFTNAPPTNLNPRFFRIEAAP